MNERPNKDVLSFIPHYLPGYRAGGPVRALANLVERIGEEFRFNVVTTDRDQGDSEPYHHGFINQWVEVGQAKVKYLPPRNQSFKEVRKLCLEFPDNYVHVTGLFSTTFSFKILVLLRLRLIRPRILIIAPRGELCIEALHHKRTKKAIYLAATKLIGFYKEVVWHASGSTELLDIKRVFGDDSSIYVAGDLTSSTLSVSNSARYNSGSIKQSESLRIIFLSRIARSKNLYGALKILKSLDGEITFDIYGPIQDQCYWDECQRLVEVLPPNIEVSYFGPVNPDEVRTKFEGYDLFLFPTNHESFGHVVLEALAGGCPVLMSDRTPWVDIDRKQVGWVVKYGDIKKFRQILRNIVAMDAQEHEVYSNNAIQYAKTFIEDESVINDNRRLFDVNPESILC